MERLSRNYHKRLQEMCDCYLETDFRSELATMVSHKSADLEEAAIKYLGLAIMYAITERATKLSFKKKGEGATEVTVKAEKEIELPAPQQDLAEEIVAIMRAITHIEGDKGETPLALGLRSGDLELQVKVKREEGKESFKLSFPEF
jgi:hypothetical protein